MQPMPANDNAYAIDGLNALLIAEHRAMSASKESIDKLEPDTNPNGSPALRVSLEQCLEAQVRRIAVLRGQIVRLGGSPAHRSMAPVRLRVVPAADAE